MRPTLAAAWLGVTGCSLSTTEPSTLTAESHLIARMQGNWRIALTPTQRQQVQTMRFLLRDPPPSNDEIRALDLSEEERASAIYILQEVRYAPDGESAQQLRSALAGLEQTELRIGPERLEVHLGGVTKAGTYEVGATDGMSAHLLLTQDDGTSESVSLTLNDEQELIFGPGDDAITFVKR